MAKATQPQPVNLTKTAQALRNAIKFGALFLVFLMVGRVLLSSFTAFWKSINPPPPPPPTMGFGYLTRVPFPVSVNKPTEYRLETISGTTPFISDRANVYRITTTQPSLLAVERAKQRAAAMGYVFEPEVLTPRLYRWTFSNPILSKLEMDILNSTFEISTNWASYPDLLVKRQQLNPTSAVTKVKAVLQQAGILYPELAEGEAKTTFIKAIGGQFVTANSLSEADFIQVDLYRKPIEEQFSSVTAVADEGPVHAVVSANGTILEMRAKVLPVEFLPVETYPLRSTVEAWQEIQSGGGYVAEKGSGTTAVVREVSLAYYEPTEETEFYQPVYVFRGDGGFTAYASALPNYVYEQPVAQ